MCQSKAQGGRRCISCFTRYDRKQIEKFDKLIESAGESRSLPSYDKFRQKILDHTRKMKGTLARHNNVEVEQKLEHKGLVDLAKVPDGGATFNVGRKVLITEGFAYSPYPELSRVVNSKDLTEDNISEYFYEMKQKLTEDGHCLGLWHDPNTGLVYLDVSVVTNSVRQAREECKNTDQIAFFDMQRFESVTVDRNATSGQKKE